KAIRPLSRCIASSVLSRSIPGPCFARTARKLGRDSFADLTRRSGVLLSHAHLLIRCGRCALRDSNANAENVAAGDLCGLLKSFRARVDEVAADPGKFAPARLRDIDPEHLRLGEGQAIVRHFLELAFLLNDFLICADKLNLARSS